MTNPSFSPKKGVVTSPKLSSPLLMNSCKRSSQREQLSALVYLSHTTDVDGAHITYGPAIRQWGQCSTPGNRSSSRQSVMTNDYCAPTPMPAISTSGHI